MQIRSLRRSIAMIAALLVVTPLAAQAGAPPEHFFLYSTEPQEDAPKFIKFGPVHLVDQFGPGDYEVSKPLAIGVPTEKNGGTVEAKDVYLQEFAIKQSSGTSFEKQAGVHVVNQCNDLSVELVKPVSVMLPSSLSLQPPAGTVPTTLDHFLCYQAKAKLPKGMQVEVRDRFQSGRHDLKKLTKLCVPVAKSGNPVQLSGPTKGTPVPITPAAITNPVLHMLCYQAKPASKVIPQNECVQWLPKDKGAKLDPKPEKHTPVTGIVVANQFGTQTLDTKATVELCIPSVKNPVCGDGMIQFETGEQCDDSNATAGDGCSAQCLIEIASPVTEEFTPCTPAAYSDFWLFDVTAGDAVVVRGDTTAAGTAADILLRVFCPGHFVTADDEVPCTFPPPGFACPEASFTAPETGVCVIEMLNFPTCVSAASAAYSLSVTRNAVATRLGLLEDDTCGQFCATFSAPGRYPFTVPKGVSEIIVDVLGAQGGNGRLGAAGGLGGRTVSALSVIPGETLQINVGGRGGHAVTMTDGGAGGDNGGASGGNGSLGGPGGGGGGASDVRQGGTALADRAVVAGGGGGSGGGTDCCGGSIGGAGGAGGGTNGSPGASVGGIGGGGATDTTGGIAGGVGADPGIEGSGGAGGTGDGAGGGGGGGLFGGGGGSGNVNELGGGGGGGGSGFGPGGSFHSSGQRSGNGLVRIILN